MPGRGAADRRGERPDSTDRRPEVQRPWEEPLETPTRRSPVTMGPLRSSRVPGFFEPDDAEPAISEEAYLSATTAEYRDLAEEIARGGNDDPARARGGRDHGGRRDRTGRLRRRHRGPGVSEEDVERVEQAAASDLTLRIISALVLVGLFMAHPAAGRLAVHPLRRGGDGGGGGRVLRHPAAAWLSSRSPCLVCSGAMGAAIAAHIGGPGPMLVVFLHDRGGDPVLLGRAPPQTHRQRRHHDPRGGLGGSPGSRHDGPPGCRTGSP